MRRSKHVSIIFRHLAENTLKHPLGSYIKVDSDPPQMHSAVDERPTKKIQALPMIEH
jgi:hypothetical protein